ncbi:MAG: hypothetical protein LH469_04565 [Frankiaceae bacterium]|nr:hypothetical protein [Frankiaceae bacterium]
MAVGALRRVKGRVRRRPLLLGVLAIGVVGGLVIFALGARPDASSSVPVGLADAYVGTTYAFDGTLCLGSPRVSAKVLSLEVEQAPGTRTEVRRLAEGTRVVLGFPVEGNDGLDPVGARVPAGEDDCTFRVLVTPTEQGPVQAGTVRVELGYGPFGLLRRTASVQPNVTLDVTGSGTDPRTDLD